MREREKEKKGRRESAIKKCERRRESIDQIAIAQTLFLFSLYLSFFFVATDCCAVVYHHLRDLFLLLTHSNSLSLSLSLSSLFLLLLLLSFALWFISRSVKNTDDRQYHLHVCFTLLTSSIRTTGTSITETHSYFKEPYIFVK